MLRIIIIGFFILAACSSRNEVFRYENMADKLYEGSVEDRPTIFPERVYRSEDAKIYRPMDKETYAPYPSETYDYEYPYYNPRADNEYYAPNRYMPLTEQGLRREIPHQYYNYDPYADNPDYPYYTKKKSAEKKNRLFNEPTFNK